MTALTESTERALCTTPRTKYFPVRGGVSILQGAVVCKRKNSKLAEVPLGASPRTDLIPLGVAVCSVDASSAVDGALTVAVDAGIKCSFDTGAGANEITADHVGQTWYMYDDNTAYLTDNGGTLSPGGTVALVFVAENDTVIKPALHFDYEQPQLLLAIAEADAVAGAALPAANVQAGSGTLVAGEVTIAATITANSRIQVSMMDPGAGAITGFASFDVPAADRVIGAPGSFKVRAIDDAKALIATAVCTFNWLVVEG